MVTHGLPLSDHPLCRITFVILPSPNKFIMLLIIVGMLLGNTKGSERMQIEARFMFCPVISLAYYLDIEIMLPNIFLLRNALAILGAGYVLNRVLQEARVLANGFHAYFLAPRGLGRTNLTKYGDWAGDFTW